MKKRSKSAEIKEEPVAKKFKKSIKVEESSKIKNKQSQKPKFEKPTGTKKPFTSKDKPGKQQSTEKPDWKALKEEKKQLKEKRKIKRLEAGYDVALNAKKLGERLRQSNCTGKEQEEITKKLFQLFKGNFKKFIFTHDISRIVQWLIKFCTPEIRQSIVEELTPELKEMWMSKYAVNCVKKFLKYGSPEIKQTVMTSCQGRVISIISHSVSASVFNNAFNNCITESTKNQLKQEFYGDIYKKSKDDKIKCLNDVFKVATDMKSATLSAVKMNLVRILNKKVINNTLVLTVLSEFLSICSAEDRSELIVMLRDSIFELSQTKEGSRIAMICIWHGTTKDRKLSLKSMKDHVKDIAISEHGHAILLSVFDSVDDTVLVKKILISELMDDLKDIVLSEFGKKVILYLVARRDTHHFHPQLIDQLKEGDGNAMSKKPQEIREKELVEVVNDPLLESIAEDCVFWLANGSIAMVTLAILKAGNGEKLATAFQAISEFLTASKTKLKEGEVEYAPVEHPGLHMMLKKLIQADKLALETQKSTFGEELAKKLDNETITKWIEYNRACFIIVFLIENEAENVVSDLKSKLVKLSGTIKNKKTPGASILLKKIK
ncbi:pumilio homolog 3 [Diachasma alloeum]|uniref:pumilio homolog 3 n=1 Tax=Diachasma alloeum TaxID=454923 RepID=UPI000738499C|nr:pumilio homolog 3 [Diachasma alloeum]XP_015114679.1 pumilio homolog 3 [Diachasma alloeum]